MNDKLKEHDRYEKKAQLLINSIQNDRFVGSSYANGSDEIVSTLRTPYMYYERCIYEIIQSHMRVLEIGAGSGAHTGILIHTGANVTAADVSQLSLNFLSLRYNNPPNLNAVVADMESLPFDDESFDAVTCAGSLSYGDNNIVMNEVYRVLKKNGVFISVDSLNHNIIYRLNRRIQYYINKRTLSTIEQMPTINLYNMYSNKFSRVELNFFGSISWLMPLFSKLFGAKVALRLSDYVDGLVRVRKSAFKVVMVAHKDKSI